MIHGNIILIPALTVRHRKCQHFLPGKGQVSLFVPGPWPSIVVRLNLRERVKGRPILTPLRGQTCAEEGSTLSLPNTRRGFLKAAAGAVALTGLAGCTMTKASEGEQMMKMMKMANAAGGNLTMQKGSPSEPAGGQGETVEVLMFEAADDSDNYHFFPPTMWVKPGTKVHWEHYFHKDISWARPHTATALDGTNFGVRLIPDGTKGWDSGFMTGAMGGMSVPKSYFDGKENGGIANNYGAQVVNGQSDQLHGGFTTQLDQEGVYLYYCQDHFKFGMSGAIVVGQMGGDQGQGPGWSPGMTASLDPIRQAVGGDKLVESLMAHRKAIETGGKEGM